MLEWIKLKRLTVPSTNKDVEQRELSHFADEGRMIQPPQKNFGSFL